MDVGIHNLNPDVTIMEGIIEVVIFEGMNSI